ncbi:hypothetical protein MRB53_038171 [Persea americana]|nr:hypothetical protein MRB53_038171 [Persea americana]
MQHTAREDRDGAVYREDDGGMGKRRTESYSIASTVRVSSAGQPHLSSSDVVVDADGSWPWRRDVGDIRPYHGDALSEAVPGRHLPEIYRRADATAHLPPSCLGGDLFAERRLTHLRLVCEAVHTAWSASDRSQMQTLRYSRAIRDTGRASKGAENCSPNKPTAGPAALAHRTRTQPTIPQRKRTTSRSPDAHHNHYLLFLPPKDRAASSHHLASYVSRGSPRTQRPTPLSPLLRR